MPRSEGDRMVLDLQVHRRTLDNQLAESEVRLFSESRPIKAVDVQTDGTGRARGEAAAAVPVGR